MTNQSTAVANRPIDTVRAVFDKMKPQFAMVLPKHITPDRMVRVALTAIQNTPKLLDCDKTSLYSAVMRAAQLGLEPDGILGQAYLIPYGDQVQFIPGYKGLIDLARRSGEVSNIIAKEVCEEDEFTVDFSLEVPFVHKPKLSADRGRVTHFWALARFKDGGFHWDYMSIAEVLAIRDASNGYKAAVSWSKNPKNKKTFGQVVSPWVQNEIEMGKKTAIRRIAKFLPMSVQKAAMVEDLVDAGKQFTTDEFGDIIIDGNASEVAEQPDVGGPQPASKLDQFAGKPPHDPETGELIDPKAKPAAAAQPAAQPAAQAQPEAPARTLEPKQIPVGMRADDKKLVDWDGWVAVFLDHIDGAADLGSLEELKKLNAAPLGNLAKANADLSAMVQERLTVRFVKLGGMAS